MMTPRTAWAADLCGHLGVQTSRPNLVGLVAWELAEGGWFHNTARYNPLNTTQPAPGAESINAVGVKSYPDYPTGMNATVATLGNGRYQPILDALAHEQGPQVLALAVQSSPWGTGHISDELIAEADQEVGADPQEDEVSPADIEAVADAVRAKLDPDLTATVKGFLTDFWDNQIKPELDTILAAVQAQHTVAAAVDLETPASPPPPPPPPVAAGG